MLTPRITNLWLGCVKSLILGLLKWWRGVLDLGNEHFELIINASSMNKSRAVAT